MLFPAVTGRILFFSIDVSPLVFIRDNSSAVKRAIYCIGHRLKIALKCLLHHNSATYTIQQFNFNCKGFSEICKFFLRNVKMYGQLEYQI